MDLDDTKNQYSLMDKFNNEDCPASKRNILGKITNDNVLEEIVQSNTTLNYKILAIRKILDQNILQHLIESKSLDLCLKKEALKEVNTLETLENLLSFVEIDDEIKRMVINKIIDHDY